MPNPIDAALAPAKQIGPYFGLVSGLTSLIPVGFGYLMLLSGAPGSRPSVAAIGDGLSRTGLSDLAVLTGISLVVGLVLHPLQFGMTQILEGYWGPSKPGRRAMARSAHRHFLRLHQLRALHEYSLAQVDADDGDFETNRRKVQEEGSTRWAVTPNRVEQRRILARRLLHGVDESEAARALGYYPSSPSDAMPTRLGNVLRRFELQTRDSFGLDAVVALPYAALIADERVRGYLDDQRGGLDLNVRLVLVWALCTAGGVVSLWRYGPWLLVPATTYLLAILSYRGAVRSAMFYGTAMNVTMTLSRQALWAQLRVTPPPDSDAERVLNSEITKWLRGESVPLQYDCSFPASSSERLGPPPS